MQALETLMYELAQLFLAPVLLIILGLFLYAFFSLGGFAMEAWQRRRGGASVLHRHWQRAGGAAEDLELWILRRLEVLRLATRTAPMLGLVATMIPMGPALMSLTEGDARGVSENLVIAFAAVIVALIAASISFWVLTVRRRWLLADLRVLEEQGHV
ncbi:MotA/TolQ/ExbB proton channel family protein [Thiococcus pfennigii]|jgi:biopolymer transport protein ExbB/TolQ|uniref:MotA/TolQ/ExbB proton channel family protein n=1 Tax=Thiococcus pfennigii TaxID=1057 RepID=UPI001905B0FC|nr:MotA/TolQ/ExbB proton channel family protein [Thiococcus pfennigii]MBK1700789.1 biopolymer transporter ExbD [Thiococcus pfennigii]MBK1730516.1 biopolymer transporter ExbD [Thiococcus pfennigii]